MVARLNPRNLYTPVPQGATFDNGHLTDLDQHMDTQLVADEFGAGPASWS